MNDNSSRSHVVLKVMIESRLNSRPLNRYFSNMMLVDLAGSECIQNAKVTGMNKLEGASINKSLLSLSKIIKKLSKNGHNKSYINYRDSKLTRIFEPILNGSCKTIVICTVSPL
jgi:capsule polysaccharide export protein KpsE/RkpR